MIQRKYPPRASFFVANIIALLIPLAAQASDEALGYSFLENNAYDSARIYLRKALVKKPADQSLQLANAKLMINTQAARIAYKKIIAAASCADSIRAEAYYRLAGISYISANYTKAESYCKNACVVKKAPYIRLYALCARINKHDSLSQALLRDTALADQVNRDTVTLLQSKMPETNSVKTLYYLQAGAFGDMENAQALRTELKQFCPNVVIIAGILNDKNMYRVRIGGFDSKESAQSYGDSALSQRNFPFRIVEE